MEIRQRKFESQSVSTALVASGPTTAISIITEDNGLENDEGIVIVSKGVDKAGVARLFRVGFSKKEALEIYTKIGKAMKRNGPNPIKDAINGAV